MQRVREGVGGGSGGEEGNCGSAKKQRNEGGWSWWGQGGGGGGEEEEGEGWNESLGEGCNELVASPRFRSPDISKSRTGRSRLRQAFGRSSRLVRSLYFSPAIHIQISFAVEERGRPIEPAGVVSQAAVVSVREAYRLRRRPVVRRSFPEIWGINKHVS